MELNWGIQLETCWDSHWGYHWEKQMADWLEKQRAKSWDCQRVSHLGFQWERNLGMLRD